MRYNVYYKGDLLQEGISPEDAAELIQLYADAFYEDSELALDPTHLKLEEVFD